MGRPVGEALERHPAHDEKDSLPGKGFGPPARSRFGKGRGEPLIG